MEGAFEVAERKLRKDKVERARAAERDMARMNMPCPGYGYAYAQFPHKSAAPAPGCNVNCKLCSRSFLCGLKMITFKYVSCPEDRAAQEKLDGLMNTTQANLSYVRTKLDQFGNTILKRWQRSSQSERAKLLVKAWPRMYIHSGGYLRESDKSRQHAARHRDLYLLPWLNADALSKDPATLLTLMHYRTALSTREFAEFDHQQIDYAFRMNMVEMEYNPHCVTMHGSNFGKLVNWDPAAFHRCDMTSFTRARLLFEAQATLSEILAAAISAMIDQTSGPWQETGRLKFDDVVENRPSLGGLGEDMAFSGNPFSAPPLFDMNAMVESLQGRLRAAEDELWLLKTDPVVAHDHIARMEGSMTQKLIKPGSSITTEVNMVQRMMVAVESVEQWQYVLQEAERVRDTTTAAQADVQRGRALPKDHADALAILEWVLKDHLVNLTSNVGLLMLSSGAFNKFVSWKEKDGIVIDGTLAEHMKDPIFYHLSTLNAFDEIYSLPLSYHMQQLGEHLGRCSSKESARVDVLLWNLIGDISVVYDALTAVRLHRPCSQLDPDMLTPTEIMFTRPIEGPIAAWEDIGLADAIAWAKKTGSSLMLEFVMRNFVQMRVYLTHKIRINRMHPYTQLIEPLKEFLHLPYPSGILSRDKLTALDQSNAALRRFWNMVETWRYQQLGNVGCEQEELETSQNRVFGSPQLMWEDPWPQERSTILAEIQAKENEVAARRSESLNALVKPMQTVWSKSSPSSDSVATPKAKAKTRAAAPGNDFEDADEPGADSDQEEPMPGFGVSRAAAAVFDQMFNPTAAYMETKWTDLVLGMIDAGFSVHPAGGSAVSFRKLDTRQTIVFHRPHPSPNIAPLALKKMGKRLTKWFGYGAETFVEKTKTT